MVKGVMMVIRNDDCCCCCTDAEVLLQRQQQLGGAAAAAAAAYDDDEPGQTTARTMSRLTDDEEDSSAHLFPCHTGPCLAGQVEQEDIIAGQPAAAARRYSVIRLGGPPRGTTSINTRGLIGLLS